MSARPQEPTHGDSQVGRRSFRGSGGNCDLVVLKAVMGHAILASTEIYVHPSHETLRRAVNDHPANEILAGLTGVEILSLQQNRRL